MATSVTPAKGVKGMITRAIATARRAITTDTTSQTRRPPSPFEDWDYDRVDDAITDKFDSQTIDISLQSVAGVIAPAPGQPVFMPRRNAANPIVVNRLFFKGDHWQNGDGWIGPHPEHTNPAFVQTMTEISNLFTSKNVIGEVTTRHAMGVVGRNMQWGFAPVDPITTPDGKPPEEVQTKIEEAIKIIRPWLQNRKVQTLLREAVCTLLLSERAGIQLIIPPGLAQGDGKERMITASTIEEALSYIYPEHPQPDNAAVICDQDTRQEAGAWRYTLEADDDEEVGEDADKDEDYAALCYVGQDGMTTIRVMKDGESSEDYADIDLDLGGRIPMFEMRRAALITLQVQQGQRALNLAESMIPRTAVTAGFLERILIDAQLPGAPEVDGEGHETGRWIEKPFYTGAGTTNFIQSTEFEDEEGKTKRAKASAIFREPIGADGPIKASDKHYRSILDETGQLHVVMAGDSNPSGTSRLNSRIEYLSTLQLTQPEVEACFRFIVDTALAMAEAISKKVGFYTKSLRCQCACRLDAGPLLPTERTAIEASIGKTISQETAMMLVGIEDVEAEKARMALDPLSRASYGSAVGDALNKLTAPGATLEGAAQFIGVSAEMVSVLMGGDPGPMQTGGAPSIQGSKDPTKPDEQPAPPIRGEQKNPSDLKKPLPAPAVAKSGSVPPGTSSR